jgi:hypothetical protein
MADTLAQPEILIAVNVDLLISAITLKNIEVSRN